MTDVFDALADPTRRRILELVAGGERTAGELAAEFATSRPGISRHLRVLREAGLVAWRDDAQWRLYRLDAEPLAEAGEWIERTRDNWAARLDAFERALDAAEDAGPGGSAGDPGSAPSTPRTDDQEDR